MDTQPLALPHGVREVQPLETPDLFGALVCFAELVLGGTISLLIEGIKNGWFD